MTNVLFLDIDGVLLPFGSYNWNLHRVFENPYKYLERMVKRSVGVDAIKKFCDDNNARIVLISTWRYLFRTPFLYDYLRRLGLSDYLHPSHWLAIDDRYNYKEKPYDINRWLRYEDHQGMWWIIDDQDQGVPEGHWIKTDPYVGYTGNETSN